MIQASPDDDQTIYQWNGNDLGNILGFADRYPAVTTIAMGDNFRSSRGVVDTARYVAEQNADRLAKIMQSRDPQSYEQGDLLALRFPDQAAEATWIVARIQALRGRPFAEHGETRGLIWSDCAILLRSVKHGAGPIVAALREAGAPYLIRGMNRLFETAEVRAAVAVFRYFQSDASSLFDGFAGFLRHQAPDYYPEGWEDAGYARPDAVQLMTVHQAKGMEFPVVFVPNLVKNRFPSKRQGGRQWYHIIPQVAVVGAERYLGHRGG